MTNRLRGIRILLLLAAMAAGVLFWRNFARQAAEEERQAVMAIQTAYALEQVEDREAELVFLMPLEAAGLSEDAPLPVFGLRWIQFSEENNGPHYALFLPAAAQAAGLRAFLGDIRLTLDGEPLANGQQLALTAGEHLLVAEDGPEPGREWEFVVMYGSEIPCMFIDTVSGSLDAIHEDKGYSESASMTLLNADGSLDHSGSIEEMRGRGNATWDFSPKRPFQIKLTEKEPLLQMPPARRWLLLANVYDKSLLRNQTVFAIARRTGMLFTPESRQIELYINGTYSGCYLLCEKVEVADSRVDIPDLDQANEAAVKAAHMQWEDDLLLYSEGERDRPDYRRYVCLPAQAPANAGSYLIELDIQERYRDSNDPCFVTRMSKPICIKSPSSATREQVEYIASIYQRLEDILYPTDDGGQPEALSQVIDLHSFAQKYLIEEITKNLDATVTSQFFYKLPDGGTKLFAGPVWDYDKALASEGAEFEDLGMIAGPEGYWATEEQHGYALWAGLCRQPEFMQAVRDSFFEEFVPVIRQMLDEGWISSDSRRILDSAKMDALRWRGGAYDENAFAQEYQQDVALIESFLAARIEFLEGEWLEEL